MCCHVRGGTLWRAETAAELEVRPYMVGNVLPMADTIMRHLLAIEGSLRAPPSRQSSPRSDHPLCMPVRARTLKHANARPCASVRGTAPAWSSPDAVSSFVACQDFHAEASM